MGNEFAMAWESGGTDLEQVGPCVHVHCIHDINLTVC